MTEQEQPAHHKLGASAAHRWMACPGSVALCESLPPEEGSSEYAEEGTLAHAMAEYCLTRQVTAEESVPELAHWRPPELAHWLEVPEDMPEFVQQYIDYVWSRVHEIQGELFVEVRIGLGRVVPDGFGTADAVVVGRDKLIVIDLKYGRGVRVDAPGNVQTDLYAVGSLSAFGPLLEYQSEIETVIHQPRLDHVSEHTQTTPNLMAFEWKAWQKAKAALKPDAELVPGESQCRWCRAQAICPARAREKLAIAGADFSDPTPAPDKDPKLLGIEDIARLLPHLDDLIKWANSVEAHAFAEALKGVEVPGYKLVQKKANRRWTPTALAAFQEHEQAAELIEPKLVGIGKAEKVLGKGSELIAAHTEKPEGAPALAPSSDKRPEYQSAESAARDFG